jgi:uncharacterized phage protein (TIGR02218 family)
MRTASAPLIAFLASATEFLMADLYTITLADGTISRYANVDIDIGFGGYTYSSKGLLLTRGPITIVRGLEVDILKVTVVPTTALIGGIPWLQAAVNGALDGASVMLKRLFLSDPETPVDVITLFLGNVSDIDPAGRTSMEINVASLLERLGSQWPYNTYQPQCGWVVYGGGCGLTRASWTVAGTVAAGSTASLINTTLAQASGYFDRGVIAFTSGACTGSRRTIKSYASGAVSVALPLPAVPSAGDTFTIYPGCDHSLDTCTNKFSNEANFRGFPFVPVPEEGI